MTQSAKILGSGITTTGLIGAGVGRGVVIVGCSISRCSFFDGSLLILCVARNSSQESKFSYIIVFSSESRPIYSNDEFIFIIVNSLCSIFITVVRIFFLHINTEIRQFFSFLVVKKALRFRGLLWRERKERQGVVSTPLLE